MAKCKIKMKACFERFLARKPWYYCWRDAMRRCTDPRTKSYPYYGGRGIEFHLSQEDVVILWERDRAWELKTPSLDRRDAKGHYCFSNCRFIEMADNLLYRWYPDNPVAETTTWED